VRGSLTIATIVINPGGSLSPWSSTVVLFANSFERAPYLGKPPDGR